MNIIELPNDILRFIINTYGHYKLMYVCNKFKNIIYEMLTKCNYCDKIIMFNKDELWNDNLFVNYDVLQNFRNECIYNDKILDKCHIRRNFMVNNIVKIVEKSNMQKFILSLYKMSLTNSTCNFLILNNKIQIITKFKENDGINNILKINSIIDPNLKCINGSYSIDLDGFDDFDQSKYKNGKVSLDYCQNKYTNNVYDLLLVIKGNTFKHVKRLTKIENLIY